MNFFLDGFILQMSLIMALGAQNIFIIESGLMKSSHLRVAFICLICDTILILMGVTWASIIFEKFPSLKIVFGITGFAFLIIYGFKKLREGLNPKNNANNIRLSAITPKRAVLLALSFSILNPHVYLDAFILIGGISTSIPAESHRLLFGLGAACFSGIWFFSLATSASKLSKFFTKAKPMKYIALSSAAILFMISAKLGVDIYGWIQS